MRNLRHLLIVLLLLLLLPFTSQATLVGVSGGPSNLGGSAEIIAAPSDALDDLVTNIAMQGFDEAQGVVTTVAHAVDGGTIAAGTLVDSHMIFLNSEGGTALQHNDVLWTFDGMILGVMSDSSGTLEAASTYELGAPGTNYTVTGPGPAAPYAARGMEGGDSYVLIDPYHLLVTMAVTEPGDWIRVITASPVSIYETIYQKGGATTIQDVDADGQRELVALREDRKGLEFWLLELDADRPRLRLELGEHEAAGLAAINLDADEQLEYVLAYGRRLYADERFPISLVAARSLFP